MFGFPYRGPGASPPKVNFKGGDPIQDQKNKEYFIEVALAHVNEMLSIREKSLDHRERRIYRIERIGRLCLAAIEDNNPGLHKALKKEFDEVYK